MCAPPNSADQQQIYVMNPTFLSLSGEDGRVRAPRTTKHSCQLSAVHIYVGARYVNTHAQICIVWGADRGRGAGAPRLVGLRSQHIHKSGLSGSCQRLHNEGHYSGRVSKLLSQGPVPGNHTHSAPC